MGTLTESEVMQHPGQGGTGNRLGVVPWIMLILLVVSSMGVISSEGWAERAEPVSYAGFQSGQVTDKRRNEIQIDKQGYSLHPMITITDDEGSLRDLQELTPGTWVKFHLKEQRIDQIVIILPR